MPAPGPGIPGDPAALQAGARSYAAARGELLATSDRLRTQTEQMSPFWSGDARIVFTAVVSRYAEAIQRKGDALTDAAGALNDYAAKLEDAQRAYGLASDAHADAEQDMDTARQAAGEVPATSPLPAGVANQLDVADAAIGAAARAMSAAEDDARRAAAAAAIAFRAVAARVGGGQAAPGAGAGGGGGGGIARFL